MDKPTFIKFNNIFIFGSHYSSSSSSTSKIWNLNFDIAKVWKDKVITRKVFFVGQLNLIAQLICRTNDQLKGQIIDGYWSEGQQIGIISDRRDTSFGGEIIDWTNYLIEE